MTHHEYIVGDGVHEVVFGKYQGWMDDSWNALTCTT